MAVDRTSERTYTIRRLLRLGMSLPAATAAVDEDRVALSLLDHLLGGPRTFTREEAAARAGVPEELAAELERISAVAEGSGYSEAEIRHLSLLGQLLRVLPQDVLLDQIRGDIPVLRTMALRTLDTAESLFLRETREEIPDPVDQAVRLSEIAGPLLDLTTDLIGQSYRRNILHLLTSDLIVEAMRDDSQTVDIAVGFVDVVGYTSLSARIDPTGLGEVLSAFEHACQSMVESRPAVQLVKFLGDAAMFVTLDPVELASGLYQLVQPAEDAADEDDDLHPTALVSAPIRGGMAAGPTLFRAGDYFGAAVNEAARLTDLARRNTVLVSDDLHDMLEDAFRLRRIRPVRLHGIGVRRPYAIKGPAGEAQS